MTLVFTVLLSACSTFSSQGPTELSPSAAPVAHDCLRWLQRLDELVLSSGVSDARAARVAGFPHLRVDRPLAQLKRQIATPNQEAQWLGLLSRLALEARTTELANLSEALLPQLQSDLPDEQLLAAMSTRQARLARAPAPPVPEVPVNRAELLEVAANCHQLLLAYDSRDPDRTAAVRDTAHVPDHYSTGRRAIGLYGVTRLGVARGIRQWETETRQAFEAASSRPPDRASRRLYSGPAPIRGLDTTGVAELLASRRIDALGRPILTEQVQQRLLRAFVPVFDIERLGPFDEPGLVGLDETGAPVVNPDSPSIYTRVTFTTEGARQLIQLVYTVWFSERPRQRALDIYAGRLDGVSIRITLNESGQPAVIDSIHPCGCYHLFFHTAHAKPLPPPDDLSDSQEWRFMPTSELALPVQSALPRLHVSISSGAHYIDRVWFAEAAPGEVTEAAVLPEDALTSLALGNQTQRRSLYGPDGIVPGTDRLERWLLWPMGIKNAGAMRQRGTQATAFVGRRHFDDGDIIDSRFDIP